MRFTLAELLIEELRDLYSVETQLSKALPRFHTAASDEDLKLAFEEHARQTATHLARLDRVMELLGANPRGKTSHAMEGLIVESGEKMELDADDAIRDAALIAVAQKIEHYEIAGYGTVRTLAEVVGEDEVAQLLQETLDEESEADERLTDIAEMVNAEAAVTEDAEG